MGKSVSPVPRGIRLHRGQFLWLAVNVLLVGATLGVERTVVPLLGRDVYHVGAAVALSFVSSFGITKAFINMGAGRWSDRIGRIPILRLGWLMGVPLVILLLTVHQWWAIILANIFLGANQGLAWTMTITAQLDLVEDSERGLAMGINEAMGYLGVAGATVAAGLLGAGGLLSTRPFDLEAVIVILGGLVSVAWIRETKRRETGSKEERPRVPFRSLFADTTWHNRALSSVTAGGFVNKLVDTTAWGVLPLYFASQHQSLATISLLSGIYGGVWGLSQFGTGLLSDHVGRKPMIVGGLILLGLGLMGMAWWHGVILWGFMAIVMGLGMAMAYPVLNAAVADVAPAQNRGAILGIYRLWRDGGYAVGGVGLGLLMGAIGVRGSLWIMALTVIAVATMIWVRMPETHPRPHGIKRVA